MIAQRLAGGRVCGARLDFVRAVLCKAYGPPDSLVVEEVPSPPVGPGDVLVSMTAASVNFPDVLMIENKYQTKPPLPFSPGYEAAGVVKETGRDVTHVRRGDRVMAVTGYGAFAEQIAIPGPRVAVIPDEMDDLTAGSFLFTYGTARHALCDRGQLRAGETLLVLGAAGGVGLAAVELGKAMGARIVAAASSAEKLALAREYGADEGVQYPPGPLDKTEARALTDRFKAACGADGAQVIYDPVGGDYTEAALRAIGWQGRHLVVGFPAGIPKLPLNLPLLKSCQIVGVFWGEFTTRYPALHAANVTALMALYLEGRIKPAVTERFPLARGGEAIARLGSRQARGKVVVMIGG
jgi:NADPH2:quinone reductase